MAVDVVIRQVGLFKKEISIQDIVAEDLKYGIMDGAFRLVPDQVGDYTVVYDSGHLCRGMEISFEKKDINLRLPLPNSQYDIRLFYGVIQRICQLCKVQYFYREDEKIRADDLETIKSCVNMDITASIGALKSIEEDIGNDKYKCMTVYGVMNPVDIGKKEISQISGDLDRFGELMNRLQNMDIYYAAPRFYQMKDGKILGAYALTADVLSVIPLIPRTGMMVSEDIKVDVWNVSLVISEEEIHIVLYDDLIRFIGEREYYDADNILITLSADEMKELAAKHGVEKHC